MPTGEQSKDHTLLIRIDERTQQMHTDMQILKELPPRVTRLEDWKQQQEERVQDRKRLIARVVASLVVAAVLSLFGLVWQLG